jgi:hypothetical protein
VRSPPTTPATRVTGRRYAIPIAEAGLCNSYDISYSYDEADHQTSITLPAAGGLPQETVTENYTGLGLPNTLTGADTYVAGEPRNDGQLPLNRSVPDGCFRDPAASSRPCAARSTAWYAVVRR